jgi:NADPH2:quinone reductase
MKAYVKLSPTILILELTDVPIPEIDDTELLIKIEAIGVGVHDEYFLPPKVDYPYVVGIEAAGIIEKVGTGVTNYKPGQRVAFVSAMQTKGGTWAEYSVVAGSSLIVSMPDGMDFEVAAGVPVAGNTILKAFTAFDLVEGDSVFIAGGSGAIGTLAIQIAKARGFEVLASASKTNHDYMKQLDVDHVFDYHDSDWQEQVKTLYPNGVNAAIATQPGTASECEPIVKDGGDIVAVSGDQISPSRGIQSHQIPHMVDVSTELGDMFEKISRGEMKLTIEKTYPFTETLEALEKVKTRHARGKITISLSAT